MRKMKWVFAAACLAFVLGGCGGNSSQPSDTAAPSAEASGETASTQQEQTADDKRGESATLRFAWWGGDDRHTATLKAIEEYQKINPNVKIEAEYQGYDGYNDKILTQLAGGTQPDIMQTIATAAAEYQAAFPDSFVKLDQQDTFKLDVFDQGFLDSFCKAHDGSTVAVPSGVSSYNLVVNKTVTDAAGVELPDNMTWDEFLEYGKQIHAADPDYYMITLSDDDCNHFMRSYVRQLSGYWTISEDYEVVSDRDALVKAFTLLQSLYKEGIAEPMDTAFAYNGDKDANKKLLNNEIACSYRGSSSIINLDTSGGMVLDVINIPIDPDAKETGVITQPSQLFMVSEGPNREEALKFMQWLYTDEDAIRILSDCRGVPPTEIGRLQLEKENLLNPVVNKAITLALEKTDGAVPPVNENSEVYGYLFPLMQELCYDTISPEEAADELMANLTEIVEKLKP